MQIPLKLHPRAIHKFLAGIIQIRKDLHEKVRGIRPISMN